MAPSYPPRRPTRRATSAATQARLHPLRRSRRRGRLLILGLTFALIAALGTRALADDGDGDLPLVESVAGEPRQVQTEQSLAVQPSADVARASDGTMSPVQDSSGEEDPSDQTTQDEQHANLGGCPGGGCSTQPPAPDGPSASAAAAAGGFSGWFRAWWSGRQQPPGDVEPTQEAQPSEETQPRPRRPVVFDIQSDLAGRDIGEGIDLVKRDIDRVREIQEQRAAEDRRLGLEGREHQGESQSVTRVEQGIRYLQAHVEAGTPEADQLPELQRRFGEVAETFRKDVARSLREESTPMAELAWRIETVKLSQTEKSRARSEGREPSPAVMSEATEQAYLDEARRLIDQLQPRPQSGTEDFHNLAELERELGEAQRELDDQRGNRGNAMSIVDLGEAQLPGSSPVKPDQVPELAGTTGSARPRPLPGFTTSAPPAPLPGTTATQLADSGVLHAQATPTQPATTRNLQREIDAAVEAEMPRITAAAGLALGLPFAVWSRIARGGLGRLALKPQPVPVPVPVPVRVSPPSSR
jgi:hypothetical protein